ncbi:MAG: LamG domain-containing protein [Ignavibacteria bacterium]|nr:LamG domain-containing protein [Ignavibacteria bacterium]
MKTRIYKVLFGLIFMLISGKSFAFMFWNQACVFPGNANGYAAFGNSASLNITGSFTIEMWINPSNSTVPGFQILAEKRFGTGGNGYTFYLNQGRVALRTNTTTRLVGNSILQNNQWTHICGTFNSSTDVFSIYVNGVLDTSVIIQDAEPVANTDSLRIGKGNVNSPFTGNMDEIRIWNRPLSAAEVYRLRKTTLGASSGIYTNLVFSLTFQDRDSQGTDFSLFDWSGNNGTGKNIGVTPLNLSDRPLNTIVQNDCIELNGVNEYLCGVDNPDVSPVNAITMEAWINPRSITGTRGIISKGTGASINYSLRLSGASLNAVINGVSSFNSFVSLIPNIWSHVCFTYNSSSGEYNFYINGRKAGNGTNTAGVIANGTDSLVIGSSGFAGSYFNGFIDEVRISNYEKTHQEVNRFLYMSIDRSNKPYPLMSNVVYNFDGYAYDNSDDGPVLEFKNSARFSHNGTVEDQPVSPVNRSDRLNFSDGFRINQNVKKNPDFRIFRNCYRFF